jgi:hypothetical protein
MPFTQFIKNKIERMGYMSYNELEETYRFSNKRVSSVERLLRPSKSPQIERIKEHGVVIGYKWKDKKPMTELEMLIEATK